MGRTLWQSKLQTFAPVVASSVQVVDILNTLEPDIRARSTVVSVHLSYTSVQTAAAAGTWVEGIGLVVGPEGGFTVPPDPLDTAQDHSWMMTRHGYISGSAIDTFPKFIHHEIHVKSARKFRGGQTTLWFSRSVLLTGAGSFQANLFARILLYVP